MERLIYCSIDEDSLVRIYRINESECRFEVWKNKDMVSAEVFIHLYCVGSDLPKELSKPINDILERKKCEELKSCLQKRMDRKLVPKDGR